MRFRKGASVLAVLCLSGAIAGCSLTPQQPAEPAPSSSADGEDPDMDNRQPVIDAVLAADPRVSEVRHVGWTYSGTARDLGLVVGIDGDETVGAETVRNILIAALDAAPVRTDFIALLARSTANPDTIVDLSAATASLPGEITMVGNELYISAAQIEALRDGS